MATQYGIPLAPSAGLGPDAFVRAVSSAMRLFRRIRRAG